MKKSGYILILIILVVATGIVSCFLFFKGKIAFGVLSGFTTLLLFFYTAGIIRKLYQDVDNFVEAVRYRDFTKKYTELQRVRNPFYRYFNEITDAFLSISREKETQQQYLKKILELVDTGILAYNTITLDTLWINESLKDMLKIPHVKNIKWLEKRFGKLYSELVDIPLGESRLITLNADKQTLKVLTNACSFETDGQVYKLIAFHNINQTLEEIEAGAWKGLLSVMTHEIMNSIAPVASLSDTLKKRMMNIKAELEASRHPDFEDIELALETIRRRSEGLLRFADTYRNLSKIIVLQLAPVSMKDILNDIYQLMRPSLDQKGITLEITLNHPSSMITVDRSLIEQVLINFITNATFAVKEKENPRILLISGMTAEGNSYITVADNGCGISPEVRDKIFIPFFTTRKNGNGIGLSLSREIVKLHKGNLQVQSEEGEGSAFTIVFS